MSIASISALGGGLDFAASPYIPPPASTRSITHLANGATVTTIRGTTGDVLAVTTAMVAAPGIATLPSLGAQDQSSTFYVTA